MVALRRVGGEARARGRRPVRLRGVTQRARRPRRVVGRGRPTVGRRVLGVRMRWVGDVLGEAVAVARAVEGRGVMRWTLGRLLLVCLLWLGVRGRVVARLSGAEVI